MCWRLFPNRLFSFRLWKNPVADNTGYLIRLDTKQAIGTLDFIAVVFPFGKIRSGIGLITLYRHAEKLIVHEIFQVMDWPFHSS